MGEPSLRQSVDVAFVGWQTLPAVWPHFGRRIGGLETAMWTLARNLAAETNLHVALLTSAPRRGAPSRIDGVTLWVEVDRWRQIRQRVGDAIDWRRRRLRQWTWDLLWQVPLLALTHPFRPRDVAPTAADPRVLRRQARLWVAFGASDDAARVIVAARRLGRPSVLFLQSNLDVDPRLLTDDPPSSPYGDSAEGRRMAIQQATAIVCQSQWQMDVLEQHFHRRGTLIRNPIDRSAWRLPKDMTEPYVLWIGRFDTFHKRPALLIDVARRCPEIPFLMVANDFDDQVRRELTAQLPPNISLRSYVPFDEMPSVFQRAGAFVSTGDPAYEGFPNVLLQAAASHTPIFSMQDYDEFLNHSGSGVV
ncbi:MAG: glycosyltransferase, partial [Planctomycetota bacterium]